MGMEGVEDNCGVGMEGVEDNCGVEGVGCRG